MLRGLGKVPTRRLRMLCGFRTVARLLVCGGFLVMTGGMRILFSRFLMLHRSLGGHGRSSRER
jgi:hypothetical protein